MRRADSGSIVPGLPSSGRWQGAPRRGLAIRWGVTAPVPPKWAPVGAAVVSAIGGLAAPAVARAGSVVVFGSASASALGLYLGVPETDHVVGVAAVLAAVFLATLVRAGPGELGAGRRPRRRAGLDRRARGAPYGGPALLAGLAMPGLLVVAPVTSHLPGPCRPIVPASMQPAALIGLQAGFTIVIARTVAPSRHDRRRLDDRRPRSRRAPGHGSPGRRTSIVVKRAFDALIAVVVLLVTAPLLAVIAIAIRIVDGATGVVPPGSQRQRRPARSSS